MASKGSREKIRRPRTDDRRLFDLCFGILGLPVVLVAQEMKLFPFLAGKPRAQAEVCKALNIAPRPAETILLICVSCGLVEVQNGQYSLTPLAEDYLLESSPTYFGRYLDFLTAQYPLFSFESVKKAVLTDSPVVYGGKDWVKSHEEQAALARGFGLAMHSHSAAPAMAWPEAVDLSGNHLLLDLGGGLGTHSMGAVRRWPGLKSVIFEVATVCEIAKEFIAGEGLESRVGTKVGDVWKDPYPKADVHLFSNFYQCVLPEKCRQLTRQSFESLEPGGRLIVHEIFYNEDKTGPYAAAAFNVIMLLFVEGRQYSGHEVAAMLTEAGFIDVEVKPTFGYWGIVTGCKPK